MIKKHNPETTITTAIETLLDPTTQKHDEQKIYDKSIENFVGTVKVQQHNTTQLLHNTTQQ